VGNKSWENAEITAVFKAKKRENRIKTVYFLSGREGEGIEIGKKNVEARGKGSISSFFPLI
jgi:hypothetical protein